MEMISTHMSSESRSFASSRTRRTRPQVNRIDAGLYLQTVCKLVQSVGEGCETVEWTVEDAGVGMISEDVCRVLALALSEMIGGAATCLASGNIQPQLRIVLRRRGTIVLCAIESRWLSESGAGTPSAIHQTQQMIAALGTSCMLRFMPERNLIVIVLDGTRAEPRIADAIAAFRLARTGHRPFAPQAREWGYA